MIKFDFLTGQATRPTSQGESLADADRYYRAPGSSRHLGRSLPCLGASLSEQVKPEDGHRMLTSLVIVLTSSRGLAPSYLWALATDVQQRSYKSLWTGVRCPLPQGGQRLLCVSGSLTGGLRYTRSFQGQVLVKALLPLRIWCLFSHRKNHVRNSFALSLTTHIRELKHLGKYGVFTFKCFK